MEEILSEHKKMKGMIEYYYYSLQKEAEETRYHLQTLYLLKLQGRYNLEKDALKQANLLWSRLNTQNEILFKLSKILKKVEK